MRAWGKALFALMLCFVLGGCSLFSPVRELLAVPSFSAQNEALKRAFESDYGKNVQYKSPISGEFLSAFVVTDLDADGADEAMVFFLPDAFTTTVHVGMMDYLDGAWQRTGELEGGGSDVYSVETIDLDADGSQEVILCWSTLESGRVMSVYGCTTEPFTLLRLSENAYTAKLAADLDGDGSIEIFTTNLISAGGSQTAQARVLHKTESGISVLDKCELDSKVSGYGELFLQRTDFGSVLYADAFKGESQMITEVICWDARTATMTAPFLDSETLTNEKTWRSSSVPCRDVDADGVPEIPCQRETLDRSEFWHGEDRLDRRMYVTQWCAFRDGELVTKLESLVCGAKWMFVIPDAWHGRFTVRIDEDADKWNFYETDPATGESVGYLCSVIFTTKTRWKENRGGAFEDCTALCAENEDMVLVYGINTESPLGVSEAQLREAFGYLG